MGFFRRNRDKTQNEVTASAQTGAPASAQTSTQPEPQMREWRRQWRSSRSDEWRE